MRVILIFTLLLVGLFARSQTTDDLFKQGNEAYQTNDFETALTYYSQIADQELESEALYYNLANTNYKLGNISSAILYYEKCLKLNSSYENALFNLQLANLRIADRIEPKPELFLTTFINRITKLFNAASWAWLFISMLFISLLGWAMYLLLKQLRLRKVGFMIGLTALVFGLVSLLFANQSYQSTTKAIHAILFSTNEYVKASPDENSTDLFILHEGVKLSIQDEIGEWINIQLADGKEGWILREAVEVI